MARAVAASGAVGLVANPASGRDIRRLVADGASVTAREKVSILRRVLAGLAATGVERVLSMTDGAGISGNLAAMATRSSAAGWPDLRFLERPLVGGPGDTTAAVERMVEAGVAGIVVLGGDGTNRLVAAAGAGTPMLAISTGTNNAFPTPTEPTMAGLAMGLLATRRVAVDETTAPRSKLLEVTLGDHREVAVVDVAVGRGDRIGAGAIWSPDDLTELFLCFATPGTIGLSSIGAHLDPVDRLQGVGLHLQLGPGGSEVTAAIGPGLITPVGVAGHCRLEPDRAIAVAATDGLMALDGERMVRFGPDDRPTVTLRLDGPPIVDVAAVITRAAGAGLLISRPDRKGTPP